MNDVDYWYHCLLNEVGSGYELPPVGRQTIGTTQIDSANFKHDLREGFPLLTTKKLSFKNIVVELLWFLRGDTNIKYLVDNGCNIWNGDAYEYWKRLYRQRSGGRHETAISKDGFLELIHLQERPEFLSNYVYGDLGHVYGKQWRDCNSVITKEGLNIKHTDQIAQLVSNIKHVVETGITNRRLLVNAWNVGEIDDMALPPCHYEFQVVLEPMSNAAMAPYWRDNDRVGEVPKYYLNLKWNQRSVDTFLGLPYNIASYSLLAHILGQITNTIPKMLYGNLSNVHIYDNHIDAVREQLGRQGSALPTLKIEAPYLLEDAGKGGITLDEMLSVLTYKDFSLEGYNPDPAIKADIVT